MRYPRIIALVLACDNKAWGEVGIYREIAKAGEPLLLAGEVRQEKVFSNASSRGSFGLHVPAEQVALRVNYDLGMLWLCLTI